MKRAENPEENKKVRKMFFSEKLKFKKSEYREIAFNLTA